MLQDPHRRHPLHVLVATPSGVGGQGGIDRLMDSLRQVLDRQQRSDIRVTFAPTRGAGHILVSPFILVAFCLRVIVARVRGQLDVVHINVASYGSTYRKLLVARLARLLGVPYVLHLHGADYRRFWSDQRPWLHQRIRRMFANAGRVVVLGRVWRDFIVGMVPEAREKVSILPNATARPALQHRGGGKDSHILFLGRLGERKGVPQLGEALARMLTIPNWRATIAGDGEVEVTRRRVAELGLDDRVSLPGWLNAERVASLIAEADILVLPSFEENLPISVIEGMASGLAVVATPVGAVEDIVTEGETGLLVPPGDVEALAGAMTRLVTDPDLRRKLGAAGLEVHRARLDIEPYADALAAIWASAAR